MSDADSEESGSDFDFNDVEDSEDTEVANVHNV